MILVLFAKHFFYGTSINEMCDPTTILVLFGKHAFHVPTINELCDPPTILVLFGEHAFHDPSINEHSFLDHFRCFGLNEQF
jgi:hypothetical protein